MSANEWDTIQSLVEKVLESDCSSGEEIEREQVRNRLFDLLRTPVLRMVRALVSEAHLVDDLAQEALIHLWQKIAHYNPKLAPFKSWASRVVINCTYSALLRHNRITRLEVHESDWTTTEFAEETVSILERAADSAPDPAEHLSERERLELVLACARETLSPDEYLVWLEQVVNGSSYQQIALLTDRNENWARQTVLRARQKLAAAIILHPKIVSREEIQDAIDRCQRSDEPLTEAELSVLQEALPQSGARKPPGWRQINRFRQACHKLLPHLLGVLLLASGYF
ncbi:MAG: sigma-70 family RNA polymerase sigma factor [Fimbriimonadales bacterium]|nr:sigma-70 family RNA polymerase sigma factor [Fimbriimonadales bacterium]